MSFPKAICCIRIPFIDKYRVKNLFNQIKILSWNVKRFNLVLKYDTTNISIRNMGKKIGVLSCIKYHHIYDIVFYL